MPITNPVLVRVSSSSAELLPLIWFAPLSLGDPVACSVSPEGRASPKSITRARLWPISTLCGLKSRWISPSAWAAASPRPAWTINSRTSGHEWGPRLIHSSAVSPSMYSTAMNTSSPVVPTS